MPNAIHKTVLGDTLQSIAQLYYQVKIYGDAVDEPRQKAVIEAIRSATPTVLTSFADDADLGAGKVLFVPRIASEVVAITFPSNATKLAEMQSDMKDAGIMDGGQLASLTQAEVLATVTDTGTYVQADLEKCHALTQFMTLDGMDTFTAEWLYDATVPAALPVTSWTQFDGLSQTDLDSVLTELTTNQGRPSELESQGHTERWLLKRRIVNRTTMPNLDKAEILSAPIPASMAADRAAFYEARAADSENTPDDVEIAAILTAPITWLDRSSHSDETSLRRLPA